MTAPIRPPIQGISPIEQGAGMPFGKIGGGDDGVFGDLLSRALGDVTGMQERKEDLVAAFLRGEPVELHELMAATEEASISLELLVETRNKLTEAYRTVMNMQV